MPKPRDRRSPPPPPEPPEPPEPWDKPATPRQRAWAFREFQRRLKSLQARMQGQDPTQKAPGLAAEGSARPDEPAWDDHGA